MTNLNEAAFRSIVAECLEVPPVRVTASLVRRDTPEWDSLNHLRLITALESELGARFTMEEIASIETIADVMRIVTRQPSA
jgi:acyl carrier protein